MNEYKAPIGEPQLNNQDELGVDLVTTFETLEQVIDTTLVKQNVTETVIASLKEKFMGLQLSHLGDKENYMALKDAKREIRPVRTLAEKICKKGREHAIAEQKAWIAKEKEIVGKIAEVEDHVDAEIKKFDDEVARLEIEKKKLAEERYVTRQQELIKMGATYQNGSFTLGDVSFEASLVKESEDSIWNDTMLPKYKSVYEKLEADRIEAEKRIKEVQAKLEADKKKFEEDQRLFQEQQDAFKNQQAELLEQQRLVDQKKRAEEEEKLNALILQRSNQLTALGMIVNIAEGKFKYDDVEVEFAMIKTWSDSDWAEMIVQISPIIEEKKKLAEEKRLEELKQKTIADEKERQRLEDIRKKEEADKADDKTKWEALLTSIKELNLPTMKSGPYRAKMNIVREKIDEINEL